MIGIAIPISIAKQIGSPLRRITRDIGIVADEDYTIRLTVYETDNDITILNVTGATAVWRLYDGNEEAITEITGTLLAVDSPPQFEFEIPASVSATLQGRYHHTIRLDFADSSAALLTGVVNITSPDASDLNVTTENNYAQNNEGVNVFADIQADDIDTETLTVTETMTVSGEMVTTGPVTMATADITTADITTLNVGSFNATSATYGTFNVTGNMTVGGTLTVGVLNAGAISYTDLILTGTLTAPTISGTNALTLKDGSAFEAGPILSPGWSLVFMDKARRFVGGLRDDGELKLDEAEIRLVDAGTITATTKIESPVITVDNKTTTGRSLIPGWAETWQDENGFVVGGIRKNGTLKFKSGIIDNLTVGGANGPESPVLVPLADYERDSAGNISSGISKFGRALSAQPDRQIAKGARQIARPTFRHSYIPPRTGVDNTVTSGTTIATLWTADLDFDWIRIVLGQQANNAITARACVAATATANDGVNPLDEAGSPVAFTNFTFNSGGAEAFDPWNQASGATATVSMNGSTETQVWGLTFSDWMQVSSLPQTGGSRFPLLMIRVYLTGTPVAMEATSTNMFGLTPTVSTYGRTWAAYKATGDYVSSTAGYPSSGTSWGDRWAPLFIQTYSRALGFQTWGGGDSNLAGTGSTNGFLSFFRRAVLRVGVNIPVVHGNFNQPGTSPDIYLSNLENILDAVKPSIAVVFPFSYNTAATMANLNINWARTMNIAERVNRYGGVPILVGYPPRDTATAGDDAVRRLGLARLAAAAASGTRVVDPNVYVGTADVPAAWVAGMSDDGVHFSNDGHARTADLLAVQMIDAIGG